MLNRSNEGIVVGGLALEGWRFMNAEAADFMAGESRCTINTRFGRLLYTSRPTAILFRRQRSSVGLGTMRRFIFAFFLTASLFSSLSAPAEADVLVRVNRGSQTMEVSVDDAYLYSWRVSTGRPGFGTPAGTFHPQRMAARWFSTVYYNAPMPHAIFFYSGFAIHGSYDIARLGGPVSHGCIRLHPNDAAILFDLVQRQGMRNTTIVVE
jgi:lipoprotein-anchoring transpeptidase ErfK/SrfK